MKKIVIFLILFMVLSVNVSAQSYSYETDEDTNLYDGMYNDMEIGELEDETPDEFKEFCYQIDLSPSDPFSFENVFSDNGIDYLKSYLLDYITSPLKAAGLMLIAIIVCAIVGSLSDNSLGVTNTMNTTATLICTVSFLVPITSLITKSIGVISTISTFMTVFIPIFAGILIACIRTSTAVGFQTVLFFAAEFATYSCTYIVLPFTNCFMAVSIAGSVSGSDRLAGLVGILKKAAFIVITSVMAIFLAVLSIQSAVAGVADTATTKTAKFFISTFVPIIGSSVSEALGSLRSCVGVLKSSVGIYAVIVILFFVIPIIIELVFYKFALYFCSGVANMFCIKSVKNIADSLSGALSIILSVVICVAVMFVFSITVVSLTGGGI